MINKIDKIYRKIPNLSYHPEYSGIYGIGARLWEEMTIIRLKLYQDKLNYLKPIFDIIKSDFLLSLKDDAKGKLRYIYFTCQVIYYHSDNDDDRFE